MELIATTAKQMKFILAQIRMLRSFGVPNAALPVIKSGGTNASLEVLMAGLREAVRKIEAKELTLMEGPCKPKIVTVPGDDKLSIDVQRDKDAETTHEALMSKINEKLDVLQAAEKRKKHVAASNKKAKQKAKEDAVNARKQAKKDIAAAKKAKGATDKAIAKEKRKQAALIKRLARGPAITWLGCLSCNKWRLVSEELLEFFADDEEFTCTNLPERSCDDPCDGCAFDAANCDCLTGAVSMDTLEEQVVMGESEGGSEEDVDDDAIYEDVNDDGTDEDEGDEGEEEGPVDQSDDDDDASMRSGSDGEI